MDRLAAERERSAFTWFLRSVMEDAGGSGLAGRAETLSLLSHAMGDDPVRMQSHVMRVMMHLGHSRLALGPVFNEVSKDVNELLKIGFESIFQAKDNQFNSNHRVGKSD